MANVTKGFEASMRELEDILESMSSNDISLDESVKLYAKAAKLMQNCHQQLEKAKVQISDIDDKLRELEAADEV